MPSSLSMNHAMSLPLINPRGQILVTGAAGFIGTRVVATLLANGYRQIRCLVRPTGDPRRLQKVIAAADAGDTVEVLTGNLLSPDDCRAAARDAAVIYHLAAGTGLKSFSDSFLNSVVTTRNLLDAALAQGCLRRFVNLSSFGVYSNRGNPRRVLDESGPVEPHPESRAEAYCYAKVKQDELVSDYGRNRGLPFVMLRPGVVYGPGKHSIPGRVGIDSFGVVLHLGGSNRIPFTYVDNCAEAIVLAGLKPGIEGETFNIVDEDLPSSRTFLRLYKQNVRGFRSIYVPHLLSYLFCWLWERHSKRSHGQLPPVFSRREWAAFWKRTSYSNHKLRTLLGWSPRVPMHQGLELFFESCRAAQNHA